MKPNDLHYRRWGGRRTAVRFEKVEAEKTLENAQTPQRRVHALLGGTHLTGPAFGPEKCLDARLETLRAK